MNDQGPILGVAIRNAEGPFPNIHSTKDQFQVLSYSVLHNQRPILGAATPNSQGLILGTLHNQGSILGCLTLQGPITLCAALNQRPCLPFAAELKKIFTIANPTKDHSQMLNQGSILGTASSN